MTYIRKDKLSNLFFDSVGSLCMGLWARVRLLPRGSLYRAGLEWTDLQHHRKLRSFLACREHIFAFFFFL